MRRQSKPSKGSKQEELGSSANPMSLRKTSNGNRRGRASSSASTGTSSRTSSSEDVKLTKDEITRQRRAKEQAEIAKDWFGKKTEGDEEDEDDDDEVDAGESEEEVNGDVFKEMELSEDEEDEEDDVEDEEDEEDDEEEEEEGDNKGDDDEENAIFEDDSDEDADLDEEDDSSSLEDDDEDVESEESATKRSKAVKSNSITIVKPSSTKTINEQREMEGEYASSDEEFERNATGDVPLEWYQKTFDHIGYDRSGEKIIPTGDGDAVSRALLARGSSKESKEFRRSVYDAKNDEVTVLTDRELTMVKRMLEGKFPHPEFEAEADYVPYYSGIAMKTSLNADHEPKRRFIPSKWERMKVEKIVRGIQEGIIKIRSKQDEEDELEGKRKLYMLWGEDGEVEDKDEMMRRRRRTGGHVPAPKMTLPGHKESYHPPPEYLLNEEEKEKLRDGSFVPQDVAMMRKLGAYPEFVRERFERCLDLYLCARKQKVKLNIDPESLVPRLPLPRELRPFPTTNAVQYLGHIGRVRSSVTDPSGEFLATGGDDGDLRIWDVQSGRCVSVCRLDGKPLAASEEEEEGDETTSNKETEDVTPASVFSIVRLAWNPKYKGVVAAACGSKIHICYVGVHLANSAVDDANETLSRTAEFLSGAAAKEPGNERSEEEMAHEKKLVSWEVTKKIKSTEDLLSGTVGSVMSLNLTQGDTVIDLCWHGKGDFLCSVATSTSKTAGRVLVHHVSKRRSQEGLKKLKGDPQCAVFHPEKPVLFVATKTHVVVQHLTKQSMLKRLRAGVKWISSIAVHPKGDHIVVGSYDCRVVWFDLDLSSKPFKTMKYHAKAVRRVCFHRKYPLMASCSDDGTVNVFHTTVYEDDLTRNPLIVPVKRIEAHDVIGGRGVLDAVFHPTQPWIFTAGADAMTVLFSNIP